MSRRALALGLVLVSCAGNAPVIVPVRPVISGVRASLPMVEGTALRVRAANLDAVGASPTLQLTTLDDARFDLPATRVEGGEAAFPLTATLVGALGDGFHDVSLVLSGEGAESEPFPYVLQLESDLALDLTRGPSGSVFRNELAILEGEGFLESGEGSLEAVFVGTFVPDAGGEVAVDARIPVLQAEPGDRTRGAVPLTTDIGGVSPGDFSGTVHLASRLSGTTRETEPIAVALSFQSPAFFEITPTVASLESIVTVRGGGFLGGAGDEVTLMRVMGTFTPEGGSAVPFGPEELVFDWRSGSELGWTIESVNEGDVLVSRLFGAERGRFVGTLTPVVVSGVEEDVGSGGPIDLRLGAIRQVVYLRFLPGFYAALPRFGVAASAGRLEMLAAERIESIYADWNVEVRLSVPRDVSSAGYAIVEVGGPDPNGIGLFGYDNTPDKDVGNLRLADRIGGENAATQANGLPGYGGVFIEGFLGWSASAEIEGTGPEVDPLFDDIFAGVRSTPATLAEVRGEGPRAVEVDRAVRALAALVGETSAHELGHSMGLADPFGSRTVFHNRGDEPGCLMDAGGARPFGERADQPSYVDTHLCGQNAEYLDGILSN